MDAKHLAFLARQPSARVQLRERFWGMPKRGIALILANAMFWQPLWAQADGIVVSSGSTSVGAAGNGVPIINIAAPNASGLSHNQFQQYNVGSQGVILNNANAQTQTQNTQLGGIIIANSNLQGASATTILNEVVSNNRTELKGYTEVAGQAARVIVANPYGITCDGCGFINTPQATLTTGKPVLDTNGNLVRFNVQGGGIAIEGLGLNADNVDQFDIITRSAKINAELHAQKLNIITGRNDVDAQTLSATALADDGSVKPQLAIDSSALGGMYAGAVKLVGTEAGVGVRLASNVAASAGDIQIDANGQLSLVQTAASGAVTVNANAVEVNGPLYAGSSLSITTPGDLAIQQNIAARDSVTLSSAGHLTNSAIIEAGVNADNSRNATGDVVLSAGNLTNTGNIVASRAVQATVTQTLNNQGATLSGQASARITANTLDNRQSGRVLSQSGNVNVTANEVLNSQSGLISSASSLTLSSASLDNSQSGRITGKGVTVTTGAFNNNLDGQLTSTDALRLTAAQVNNSEAGRIASAMALTAVVTGLDQHADGRLYSNGDVSLDLGNGHLNNQDGLITAPGQLLLTNLGTVDNQRGEISSAKGFTLAATSLDNTDGSVLSDEALIVRVDQALTNLRGLVSATGVEVSADTLNNRGGVIRSDLAMKLLIDTLDNSQTGLTAAQKGTITSKAGLEFIGTTLNNQNGLLNAAGVMTLQATTVLNGTGRIASQNTLSATVDNLTQHGGELVAEGTLTLTGKTLDNGVGGLVGATKALKLEVSDIDNRAGELSSQVGVEVIGKTLDNRDGGKVLAGTALQLIVERVINENKGLLFGQTLILDGKRLDNAGGTVASQQAQTLTLTGALDNRAGLLSSETALTIKADSLDSTQGTLSSADALKVTTDGALINKAGSITTDAALTVVSGSLDNSQKGKLSGQGATTVTTGAFDNSQGGQLTSSDTLELTAGHVINQRAGRIASALALTASVTGLDQQSGELFSNTSLSLDLNNGQLNNQGGLINSPGALLLKNLGGVSNVSGEISSAQTFTLAAQSLDNSGGKLLGTQGLILRTAQAFTNRTGTVSAATLEIESGSLDNTEGLLSSRAGLKLTVDKALNNVKGTVIADGDLEINAATADNTQGQIFAQQLLTLNIASTTNRTQGLLSGKTGLTLTGTSLDNTGGVMSGLQGLSIDLSDALDNSQGLISSGEQLDLTAGELTNHDGSIASHQAMVASVSRLNQHKGSLTSDTTLSLDLNQGQLDNQGGLINAPGTLLLKNLGGVLNQGGEISSAQAFTLNAKSLDNSGGTLLSNQVLTLRIAQALNNVKGLIAAAGVDATAGTLDNTGGTLTSRNALDLTVTGLLTNRDKGLINAAETLDITSGDLNNRAGQLLGNSALTLNSAALDTGAKGLINSRGTLSITADSLTADTGGEVSGLGAMTLVLNALSLNAGRLIGSAGLSLDLNGADLNNQAGLITAEGPLTFTRVRDVNNQGGEISSAQSFTLDGRTLDNSGGSLISSQLLTLNAASLLNQNGLISGWQGLDVTATSLDNRNRGTLSSRNGAVDVDLSGALLNSGAGALVSQTALTVTADSLDNRGGILSSGAAQTLTVTGLLNNRQSGLIDSGADLAITANALDNSAGTITSPGKVTLDLIGALTNTGGTLASGGDWLLKRSSAVHNQGGQLISQRLMTLNTGLLDNSHTGTVAANGTLLITATGKVLNHTDGLIHSQNADVELDAVSLDNARGAVQGQSTLKVKVSEDVDNQSGRLIAQNGDLTVEAASLDSRGGVLSSLKGLLTTQITGILRNGYDRNNNRQGGVIQGQRLSLTALGGFDNYGGRVSASTGEALLTTANLDNRNGGIYAKGLVRVIGKDLDNSGDNDGQIAGGQVDLRLTGALNNRLGIIESDSTLAITAASLDNQTGQIRSLGTRDAADFQIGTLFDNRNGTVEVANSNLTLNAASFLNTNGSLLHAGTGTFGLSTVNLIQAGGNLVTRGDLTVTADNWTNSSVIQAARLTVNVGTFNQTASGQLLASSAFVGTGGTWTNDGVIASDGTLSLNLTGGYAGNGRTSSLGTLNLTASQLALGSAASLTGGARTELNITGLASNYGRITSAADLIVNAGSVTNYGTLGATQNLTFNTASLLNSQGLIFSGADMQANVGSLTNLKGDFYALNNLTIKGYGVERANQVSNISGSMESGGNFAISATAFENRTEGSDGTQDSTAGRTLVKGIMAMNCLVCARDFLADFYVKEYFEGGQDADITASAFLMSGRNFTFVGGGFLNSKSTIGAAGDVVISADSFRNLGAVSGAVERTRIYRSRSWGDAGYSYYYNQRNSPDFPNYYYVDGAGNLRLGLMSKFFGQGGGDTTYGYVEYELRDAETLLFVESSMLYPEDELWNENLPISLYDRKNLVEVPEAITRLELLSDIEKVVGGSSASAGRSAIIQSGGNVSITATQDLQNSVIRQDYVAGGGTSKVQGTSPSGTGTTIIRVNAQLPPDLSQQQVNPLTLPGFSLPTGQNGLFRLNAQTGSNAAVTQTSTTSQNWALGSASVSVAQREQTVSDAQTRALQSGTAGQVSTTTRQLADVVRQNSGLSANASAFDSSTPANSANSQLTTGVTQVADVTQAQAGTAQVARVQGLPGSTTSPNAHRYLIETNPVLTELRQFMSSDYLLANLGYDPDVSTRRLGDGFYEQRLVQQAVVARTGQAFLAGQTSNEDQFKYLMNNAIASKEQLNLAVGVSLSSKQVAALTHDIVWLEEHEVNGEKVLVPVLYLAQANNRLGPTGALIAGNDVTLIAGDDLDNVGTLRATNNLSATASNNLVNVGLVESGNRLDLLAGNDLVNKAGGILYGRDVTLTATRGDVINERTVTRAASVAGYQDFADSAARVESANDLTIKAGRDVQNTGGTLLAGRDLGLIAGRDVDIGAVQTEKVQAWGANSQSSITQIASNISAGRDLTAQSGRDISVIASNIDAKRDIAMAATENLSLSSAADEQHSSSKAKKSTSQQDRIDQVSSTMNAGGNVALSAGNNIAVIASHVRAGGDLDIDAAQNLTVTSAADEQHSYSKTKKVTSQQDRITQVSSTLSADGNVALGSGKDMEIIASHVQGGGDVDIDAAQDLTITSAMDESSSFYSKKSKGSFGRSSSKQQESYDSTNVASIIEAGGDLTVNTSKSADGGIVLNGGHDVTVMGSQLKAGNDLLVGATNDVAVLSGVEEHGSYSKKTKSGFLGLSKSGKSQLTTTASQVASELEADNDVVIAAGNDVRLRASETSAGNDVELRAGLVNDSGDINLVSANDTAYSRSEEYKKKTGLSASGGFISISSAKEAGREAQSSTSVGSNVLADRDATLQATRDVNVLGSGINAGRNVSLNAGRDVNIVASQNESAEQEWSKNKQVGIGVSGDDNGVSLFIGADSLQEKNRLEQQTAAASQISAGQDLAINAKRDINQIGSDLSASNDINLTAGRNINIDAAREAQLVEQQRETERSGLGVSINHNFGKTKDAVNGAGQGDDAVSQGSSTLKGIDAISQFLAGPTADVKLGNSKQSTSQEIIEQTSRSSTLNAGNDLNMTAGNDVTVKGGQLQAGRDINIKGRDITLDVAKDSISQESSQSESWGGIHGGTSGGFKLGIGGSYGVASEDGTYGSSTATQAAAGRDINLDASNDINLVGTQVTAGRDIDLNAGNDLNIRSAQNESNSESDRHSGGGEVGLTFGSQGVGVYASVSMGKGNLDRDSARQQNASLNAGNQLGFSSGNDTNVAGATLRGDEVVGRVGGDLNVSSVTDTGKVEGKEFDINATVTIGPGAGISGSVGYGATNGSTNWVGQQTSITGKDKVDIRTENHTQLDGALIASDSGNLKLDTGTLGFSDIAGKDKEHGYYLNVGGTYNPSGSAAQDSSQEGKGEKSKNGWSVEGWNYEKDREQIVRATVGAGEVVVRNDAETGGDSTAGLNRDVSKAYEITKDEESRTDLYVSKSSLEAVSDPSGTLKAWKEKIENYSDAIELAFEDVLSLINGPVMVADQVWKEVQAQRVSLDEVSASSRSKLGDELALDLAKVLVRNGKSLGDIDKLGDDDITIIQSFAQKFIEFGSGQVSCGADECGAEAQGGLDYVHYRDEDANNKVAGLTALKLDTAGRKMLEQSERLQSYLDSLPVEQAQLLALGIQAVMGPAKMAVGLAGNVLIDKLFGEKLTEIKDSLAKNLASELSGEDRARLERSDKLLKELYELKAGDQKGDVYVRGATALLNIALGTAVNSMGAVGGKVIGKGANADSPSDGLKIDLDQKFGENPPKGWVDTAPAPKPTSTLPDSYHDVKVSDTGGLPEGGQRVISVAGTKGEVSGLLPKPGATSIPASGVGAGAAFKVDSKQLGKKLGKHVEDFGGNAASPADRKMVLDKIHDVGSNPEKVIPGTFAGQGANGARGDVFFRIKGNDVVVTKPDGTFVTILKDGVTQNPSVQSALKGGGR